MYKELLRTPRPVAGPHLLKLQYLFKFLEALFAAIDLLRLCRASLILLLLVERLSQSLLLIKLRERAPSPTAFSPLARLLCESRKEHLVC